MVQNAILGQSCCCDSSSKSSVCDIVRGSALTCALHTLLPVVSHATAIRGRPAVNSCSWSQLRLIAFAVDRSCSWPQLQLAAVVVGRSCSWSQLQLVADAVAVGRSCGWSQLQLVADAVGRSCSSKVAVAVDRSCSWPQLQLVAVAVGRIPAGDSGKLSSAICLWECTTASQTRVLFYSARYSSMAALNKSTSKLGYPSIVIR